MEQKYTICFVCTGNACRSPFAECVLKSMLEQEEMDNIEVFSRGTLDWGKTLVTLIWYELPANWVMTLKVRRPLPREIICTRQTVLLSLMQNTAMPLPKCLTMHIGTGL